MSLGKFDENEPLLDGMASLPPESWSGPVPSQELKDRIWRRTVRTVRWRPARRRLSVAGAVLAAYLAGLATFQFLGGPAAPPTGEELEPGSFRGAGIGDGIGRTSSPGHAPTPSSDAALVASPPASPSRLEEEIASVPEPDRSRLLKRAGDLYLSEAVDVAGALHCYRRLLASADPAEQATVDPDDSWLLFALKQARQVKVEDRPKFRSPDTLQQKGKDHEKADG